ncbi:MAG: hypothetical protein OCU20_04300 [Methanophagales archaeon]|nr:hypothetical protein [Methanophagales archaeon]MCW3138767.1 hypothetical protein [Methanophagales archaeon]MCW3140207.1 hypothetical protein [Methanophagales archaeon]MCW7069096.1 hypothetical protein [Methanophagales archaeon]MCW7073102.1 hypothetical protein [Methanophagales archaeon]
MIQQRIYLSRRAENSIEFEHEVLQIPLNVGEETSFEIRIINYGEPSHLHFSLGEEIADRVMLLQDKVYVIDEEKIAAIVRLPKSYAGTDVESGLGEISVSTGYGAVRESFMIEIVPEQDNKKKKERVEKHVVNQEVKAKVKVKEPKRELKVVTPQKEKLIHHLLVTLVSTALFLFSFFIVNLSFHPFIFAIIASALFLLIVVYNL